MSRFSEVTYDASTQTAIVGGGLVWDDAYSALAPFNVTVVGGRKSGVGVAGFALGGGRSYYLSLAVQFTELLHPGYSWLSNQYGLTIDTIVAYELVKPNGDIVTVTQTDPGLFSSLKGGMSNFGIVTRFTFKTFPQGRVWGGLILFKSIAISAITEATAKFSALVTDPKAAIITSYTALPGEPGISLHLFYDGPNPPPGIFDEFLKIPFYEKNVKTRKFLDLVQVFPVGDTYGQRGIFNGVSIPQYTPRILDVIANETVFWAARLMPFSASDVDYGVQPFLPTLFSHGDYESSAYPPVRGKHNSPLNIYYAWSEERFDAVFHDAARMSAARIRAAVVEEGQDVRDAAVYPNYAIYDTPLEAMYGSRVGVLKALKKEVDPMNVMGLTGGFRF
ncbi:hypothetical protein C0991_012101 [Blastosporella zonata]|nr:hypothetical protein C0991_012101 [Blastosporella zonata]